MGYSLGTGGNDPATYYEKCAEATRLYDALLDGCASSYTPTLFPHTAPHRNLQRIREGGSQTGGST